MPVSARLLRWCWENDATCHGPIIQQLAAQQLETAWGLEDAEYRHGDWEQEYWEQTALEARETQDAAAVAARAEAAAAAAQTDAAAARAEAAELRTDAAAAREDAAAARAEAAEVREQLQVLQRQMQQLLQRQ